MIGLKQPGFFFVYLREMRSGFLFIAFLFSIYACKKAKDPAPPQPPPADTTVPVITLSSPANASVYHNGDTLKITGVVTDNDLHSGSIEIKDDTTAVVYFTASPYVHGLTSANINYSWIVTGITQNAAATITLQFNDHHPNVGVKQVHVILQP
jgi:hypothetical protein